MNITITPTAEPEKVVMTFGEIRRGCGPDGVWSGDGKAPFVVGSYVCGKERPMFWVMPGSLQGIDTIIDDGHATYLGPIASIEIKYTPHTGGTDAK